jgi:hypothetical protein
VKASERTGVQTADGTGMRRLSSSVSPHPGEHREMSELAETKKMLGIHAAALRPKPNRNKNKKVPKALTRGMSTSADLRRVQDLTREEQKRINDSLPDIVIMLFVPFVTYNIADPDDGACEMQTDEKRCLKLHSAVAANLDKCH